MPRFIPCHQAELNDGERLERARAFQERLRRSLRFFSDRPLPEGMIEALVAAAGCAPSGANRQPWTFVAVTDPELKREVRIAAEEVPDITRKPLDEILLINR